MLIQPLAEHPKYAFGMQLTMGLYRNRCPANTCIGGSTSPAAFATQEEVSDLLRRVTSFSIHILVRLHGNHSTSLRAQWKSGLICVPYLRRAILHPIHHQELLKLQKPSSDGFRCVASSTRKLKMFRLPYGKYWMSLV